MALLCYHNSTWENYISALPTRQLLDTVAVVLIAIEGAVVQLVKASRTIKVSLSRALPLVDLLSFVVLTISGSSSSLVGTGWSTPR